MKIFLSALETGPEVVDIIIGQRPELLWNLCSFHYVKNRLDVFEKIKHHSKLMMVDSGAFSIIHGKKTDFDQHTRNYIEFIKRYDDDKMVGFFEMDIDNIVGCAKAKELRRQLEQVTDKIIPVWHKIRGIEAFKSMCREYRGKTVAIACGSTVDIQAKQYGIFVKQAHDEGCKIHGLAMTRKKILDTVPFDYVDSASWKKYPIYGIVGGKKISRELSRNHVKTMVYAYLGEDGMKLQEHYHDAWKHYHND